MANIPTIIELTNAQDGSKIYLNKADWYLSRIVEGTTVENTPSGCKKCRVVEIASNSNPRKEATYRVAQEAEVILRRFGFDTTAAIA